MCIGISYETEPVEQGQTLVAKDGREQDEAHCLGKQPLPSVAATTGQ